MRVQRASWQSSRLRWPGSDRPTRQHEERQRLGMRGRYGAVWMKPGAQVCRLWWGIPAGRCKHRPIARQGGSTYGGSVDEDGASTATAWNDAVAGAFLVLSEMSGIQSMLVQKVSTHLLTSEQLRIYRLDRFVSCKRCDNQIGTTGHHLVKTICGRHRM